MYLSPNWMLSRVRSVKRIFFFFFRNALSRAHRGFLVPTSLWLGPIDSLPFATVVFWLHFFSSFFFSERKSMERKLPCQLFTATNWSTLARHVLKLICQTTLIQFCSSRYWAMRVSCLVTSGRSRDRNAGFSAADDAMLEASCLFSFKSILLRTSMSIYQTVWMLLAECSESISHNHTAHIKKCPDSIVGKRQRPQAFLIYSYVISTAIGTWHSVLQSQHISPFLQLTI